jgi:hypothetical protein
MRSLARRVRAHRRFAVLVALSVLVRAALLPQWHGQDFTVWSLASAATLHGDNIYAHHPNYPGGPFAYLPLFVYVELPFRWLADVFGASFTVLGKVPMVAADLGVTTLLYRAALARATTPARAARTAGAFALNPLVLYNSALYGRFDSLACVLLLAWTTRAAAGRSSSWWLGAAVAAKTFPALMIPAALAAVRRRDRPFVWLGIFAVPVAACAPYLCSLPALLHDVLIYDGGKYPSGESWWLLLRDEFGNVPAAACGVLGLLFLALGARALGRNIAIRDLDLAVAATLVLFLICAKVVLEQYLTWPLPWLLLLTCSRSHRVAAASGAFAAALTVLGLLDSESFHPLGRDSLLLGIALTACAGLYLFAALRAPAQDDQHASGRARWASPSGGRPYMSSTVRRTL